MSLRPTPETDCIVRNVANNLAATLTVKCGKLERERDEARMQYRTTELLGMALVKTIDELKAEVAGYRDEACRESCRDKAAADRVGGNPWSNI